MTDNMGKDDNINEINDMSESNNIGEIDDTAENNNIDEVDDLAENGIADNDTTENNKKRGIKIDVKIVIIAIAVILIGIAGYFLANIFLNGSSPEAQVEKELEQIKSEEYLAALEEQVASDTTMATYAEQYEAFLTKAQDFDYEIVSVEEGVGENSEASDEKAAAEDTESTESSDETTAEGDESADDSASASTNTATVVVKITTYDFGQAYLDTKAAMLEAIENDEIIEDSEIEAYIYTHLFEAFEALEEKTYSKEITITLAQEEDGNWVSNLGESTELRDAIFGGIGYAIENGTTESAADTAEE